MIGDTFIVQHPDGTDRYDHCTVKKTILDYLDRVDKGLLVTVDTDQDGFISNPQQLARYFIDNHLDEVKCDEHTVALLARLARRYCITFVMHYWHSPDVIITDNLIQAANAVNNRNLQFMRIMYFTEGQHKPYASRFGDKGLMKIAIEAAHGFSPHETVRSAP